MALQSTWIIHDARQTIIDALLILCSRTVGADILRIVGLLSQVLGLIHAANVSVLG